MARFDISYVWKCVELLAVAGLAWLVFRLGKRIRRAWIRRSVRIPAVSLLAVSAPLAALLALVQADCTGHAAPLYSPDGRYVALMTGFFSGALGDDYANVDIRPWWRPYAHHVYAGVGTWNFRQNRPFDPEVSWIDSTHLLIEYVEYRTGFDGKSKAAACRSPVDGVEVTCKLLPEKIPGTVAGSNAAMRWRGR